MSIDLDALAQVHEEQGYLILNSERDFNPGDILQEPAAMWVRDKYGERRTQVLQPVVIVGSASREEFIKQNRRLDQILGTSTAHWECLHPRFYKVVATD